MMSFVQTQKTDKRGAVTLGPMMQGPVTITAKASRRSAPQTATTSIDLRDTLLDEVTVQLEQGAMLWLPPRPRSDRVTHSGANRLR
jgi:hypothetical protein